MLYCYRFPKQAYHFGPLEAESTDALLQAIWPHWKGFAKEGEQMEVHVWEVTQESYIKPPPPDVRVLKFPCSTCGGSGRVAAGYGGGSIGSWMQPCQACQDRKTAEKLKQLGLNPDGDGQ